MKIVVAILLATVSWMCWANPWLVEGRHEASIIAFKHKTTCKASSCDVDATANLNLKDFDIKVRSYMGVTVKPDVTIRAKFSLSK